MAFLAKLKALFIACVSFYRPVKKELQNTVCADNEQIGEGINVSIGVSCLVVNREVVLDIYEGNEPAFFSAYKLEDSYKLVINGRHPTYSALSSFDISHPLVQWLTTWVKLIHAKPSEHCKSALFVAQDMWEERLADAGEYEVKWEYGSLPQYLLFDVSFHQGDAYLVINRHHLFYQHVLMNCEPVKHQEFLQAIMAWSMAESHALSQSSRTQMANARVMLCTLLHDAVDEALEDTEV